MCNFKFIFEIKGIETCFNSSEIQIKRSILTEAPSRTKWNTIPLEVIQRGKIYDSK